MSTLSRVEATIGKPIIAGGLAAAYSWYSYPGNTLVFGTSVPDWAVIGAATAAATFVGELMGVWILPKVSNNQQLASIANVALNPALAAGATALSIKALSPLEYNARGFSSLALIGGGSYVVADYLSKNALKNYF